MSAQFWFARLSSRGVGGPRMTPVSGEGWLVVAAFVAAMVVGALLFIWQMIADHVAVAVVLFAFFAIVGGGGFIWASLVKGDMTRTAADYRRMRQGGST